jgi:rubrerythrin
MNFMNNSLKWITLALSLLLVFAGALRSVAQKSAVDKATVDNATRDALVKAVNDERHAQALYQAVINRYGEARPFSNIIKAERQHERLLLELFKTYHLAIPTNPWKDRNIEVPDTLKMACSTAIKAEEENIALYERLLKVVKEPDIREVFQRLHDASKNNHLPAFKRCAANAGRRGRRR